MILHSPTYVLHIARQVLSEKGRIRPCRPIICLPRPRLSWYDIWSVDALSLLLVRLGGGGGCCSGCFGGLLPVAADHDYAEEGSHHGGAQEDKDHGDADRPDAWGEEVLEGVVCVDEGLFFESC